MPFIVLIFVKLARQLSVKSYMKYESLTDGLVPGSRPQIEGLTWSACKGWCFAS
jgi:hypothetical protein